MMSEYYSSLWRYAVFAIVRNQWKILLLTIIVIACSVTSFCQSICATGDEGSNVTITAPPGMVFISVTFASYGTPNGSCGSFTIGGCHAANSQTIVEAALLGQNSATIAATNGVFGDPCGGTFKRLYIEAVYSAITPLTLLSFSGTTSGDKNVLQWETTNEINSFEFIIESSVDGIQFSPIGKLPANNRRENSRYQYTDHSFHEEIIFYRLKMTDSDGSYTYSKIVSVKNREKDCLLITPNPATEFITLNHQKPGWVELMNMRGEVLQKIRKASAETIKLNLTAYSSGIYIIRYSGTQEILVQKIVKQ